jgi:hypothetical protein
LAMVDPVDEGKVHKYDNRLRTGRGQRLSLQTAS